MLAFGTAYAGFGITCMPEAAATYSIAPYCAGNEAELWLRGHREAESARHSRECNLSAAVGAWARLLQVGQKDLSRLTNGPSELPPWPESGSPDRNGPTGSRPG